jgi:hypothetical protein
MRSLLIAATLMLFAAGAAQAKVSITVDKDAQMMTVAVDGVERYHWPVSTGNPSHETPNGSFRTFRMEEDHYSKEFDDAPMPHSIFFTKIGHAIHGTESEGRLGTPVSHGCVRLSRANATTLYALVQEQGVLNTTVTLTGSSTVALARNPRRNAVARRDPAPQEYAPQEYTPQYGNAAGDPTSLAPQMAPRQVLPQQVLPQQVLPQQVLPQQVLPQARADDGYIYPADGSSTDQRYPAPRPSRRAYDGQVYYYQQQQTDAYGNAYQQPRSYYQQQPRTYYYPN